MNLETNDASRMSKTVREKCPPMGKEAVLQYQAVSGRAGEVAAGVGWVRKDNFFSILLERRDNHEACVS